MAVTYSVTYVDPNGPTKTVNGTFTSAAGDGNGETIPIATHGLAYITEADVSLDPAGLAGQRPKIVVSGSTVTWTVDDTMGYSGRWKVRGK